MTWIGKAEGMDGMDSLRMDSAHGLTPKRLVYVKNCLGYRDL